MNSLTKKIWDLLQRVQSLRLKAFTGNRSGFFHRAAATGRVMATASGHNVLTFHETGRWISREGQTVDFQNVYRWSLIEGRELIGLEHLRYGSDNPVHLVDLAPCEPDVMRSIRPHHCGDDHYSAQLVRADDRIHLRWKIQGPAKNDTLNCLYLTDSERQGT